MLRRDPERPQQADHDRRALGEGPGGGHRAGGGEGRVEEEEAGGVLPDQVRLGPASGKVSY